MQFCISIALSIALSISTIATMAAVAADSSFFEDVVLDEADDHDLDVLFQAGDISEFADDVAPAPAAEAPAD